MTWFWLLHLQCTSFEGTSRRPMPRRWLKNLLPSAVVRNWVLLLPMNWRQASATFKPKRRENQSLHFWRSGQTAIWAHRRLPSKRQLLVRRRSSYEEVFKNKMLEKTPTNFVLAPKMGDFSREGLWRGRWRMNWKGAFMTGKQKKKGDASKSKCELWREESLQGL